MNIFTNLFESLTSIKDLSQEIQVDSEKISKDIEIKIMPYVDRLESNIAGNNIEHNMAEVEKSMAKVENSLDIINECLDKLGLNNGEDVNPIASE